jgi:hypothetical protein
MISLHLDKKTSIGKCNIKVFHSEGVSISEKGFCLFTVLLSSSHVKLGGFKQGILVTFHLIAETEHLKLSLILVIVEVFVLHAKSLIPINGGLSKSLLNKVLSLKGSLLLGNDNVSVKLISLSLHKSSYSLSHLFNEVVVKL